MTGGVRRLQSAGPRMGLCSCVFTLDFRGHRENGTFYAMQLAEGNLSDLRVLGGWMDQQEFRRKQFQSYY